MYDKMNEYIESIFNIFKIIKEKARLNNDKKMQMISLMIYNYVRKMLKEHKLEIETTHEIESINLIPFFE